MAPVSRSRSNALTWRPAACLPPPRLTAIYFLIAYASVCSMCARPHFAPYLPLSAAFSDFSETGPQLLLNHLPLELGRMPALSHILLGGHRVSGLPAGLRMPALSHVLLGGHRVMWAGVTIQ